MFVLSFLNNNYTFVANLKKSWEQWLANYQSPIIIEIESMSYYNNAYYSKNYICLCIF